ncbi:MAG: LTA synthase family protein [Arcticibacter sp.]
MRKRFEHFYNNVYKIFCIYIFQLLLFTCFRISFIVRLHNTDIFSMPVDTAKAFFRGFQFDTMVISYSLVIPFCLFLSFIFVSSTKYRSFIEKFVWAYCGISVGLFMLVLFIDQYFYNYFQSHINILIFGLIDDDTKAVMTSVWSDYPILRIFLLCSSILSAYAFYAKRLYRKRHFSLKMPLWANISASLAIVGILVLGIRQSLSTFPLQSHDTSVSTSKSINFLATNGVYALKTAFSERNKADDIQRSSLSLVHEMGYDNIRAAAKDYFSEKDLPADLTEESAIRNLFSTTPKNAYLARNKPNVIFLFMESMSNYNMMLNSGDVDVMGRLKPHFGSDVVFRNFVSSGNSTVQSLEFLLTNSPIALTQSRYRFQPLPTGTAQPFKRAGFETIFVTGGETSWRNIHELAPNQGFDKLFGREDIYKEIQHSTGNHWGAYDEYLFEYVFRKLSADQDRPKFMFIQTTSNHTPFDLPATYKPLPIELPADVKKRLLVEESLAIKNLNCLQYSNDCLGAFLDKLKHSPLASNTIVVATGDHNNLMLFDFDETGQLSQRGVPLYMYIPKRYSPQFSVDTSRYGSHKDIFPTIYNLALSEAKYFNMGENLLREDNKKGFYGVNLGSFTAYSADAAVNYSPSSVLYRSENKLLKRDSTCSAAHKLLKQARASYAMSVFTILKSLKVSDTRGSGKQI